VVGDAFDALPGIAESLPRSPSTTVTEDGLHAEHPVLGTARSVTGQGGAHMHRWMSEVAMRELGRIMVPLSSSRSLAVAAGWGIRGEALCRRVVELQLDTAASAIGLETSRARRRQRERAEAVSRRQPVSSTPPRRHGRTPAVNWHEGGDGPPLLLLNGWTASGLSWPGKWLRRLEDSFHVIRIDNRGTGWSRGAPMPFTIADLADDARDVLDACGADRAVVLGTSMGGMIAQELALRHPDRVERLLLIATRPPTPAHITSDYTAAVALLAGSRPGQDRRAHVASVWARVAAEGFAEQHPEILDEAAGQVLERATPRSTMLMQARAVGSWRGPRRLSRLSVPTTVVHGRSDPLVAVQNGRLLAELIPGATLVELPGVGHLVAHEAGDSLLGILEGYRSGTGGGVLPPRGARAGDLELL